MKIKLFVPLALLTIILSACTRVPNNTIACSSKLENCIYIEGKLNDQDIINVQRNPDGLDLVILNSSGGQGYIGNAIGKILFDHDIPVLTLNTCSSACAENILPGAKFVVSKPNTRFGLHGNAIIDRQIAISKGFVITEECEWRGYEWLRFIYDEKDLSYDFVEKQKQTMPDFDPDFVYTKKGCVWLKAGFKRPPARFFPTVDELRDDWGLDIRTAKSIDYQKTIGGRTYDLVVEY
jgi:hypothetical protein